MTLDPDFGTPTNVVFMGMGEPLHNWENVSTALTILNDPEGVAIGARRITVSTIGILPNLRRFAARPEQFRFPRRLPRFGRPSTPHTIDLGRLNGIGDHTGSSGVVCDPGFAGPGPLPDSGRGRSHGG